MAETETIPRPWLKNYDPEVPHTLKPQVPQTMLNHLARHVRTRGSAAAIRFQGRVTSFVKLNEERQEYAAGFSEMGIKKGDVVALVLPNCPQFIVAELALWTLGAIVAPMNPTYTAEELAVQLKNSGATVAVVLSPFYEKIKAIQSQTDVQSIAVARIRDALPWHMGILFGLLKEKKQEHRATLQPGDRWLKNVAVRGGTHAVDITPDDPAVLLPSGGTSGTPKGVLGSHNGLSLSGSQLFAWLSSVLTPYEDTLMLPLPLFHVYGCAGVQGLALAGGLSLTLVPDPRNMTDMLKTIERERPTFLCTVPTLLIGLMQAAGRQTKEVDFSSIKLTFSGASPLMADTKQRFEELTGGKIVEGYSLTEAQMAAIANPVAGVQKIGSVGMPLPDVDVRIADAETGQIVMPLGEVGEIQFSATQLMLGYHNNPEETAAVFTVDVKGRRWLMTGDLGYIDPDGYVFIVDRKKDLIKVSGFQVWPREVEEAVASHPAVLEVGVAAIPDEKRGETPKAWVVLRDGATATEKDIRAHCRDLLAAYRVPSQVAFVDALPKSPVGKVLRRKLKDLG